MPYILRVKLKANKSNFSYEEGRIHRWRYYWENNQIFAYSTVGDSVNKNIDGAFNFLQSPVKLDLGLLIDVLTIATELIISTEINYQLCEADNEITKDLNNHKIPINDLLPRLNALRIKQNGHASNEWPNRIREGTNITFNDQAIKLSKFILGFFNSKIIKRTELKLLNYWRRGADLEELQYFDESYLAFFKILEYFEQLYRSNNTQIPSKYRTQKSQMAYRIAMGAKLKDVNDQNIKYLESFVEVRDSWDIAHMRVGILPEERDGAFYITYYDGFWDLHADIRELTKLFLLKFLGLGNLEAVDDGGLISIRIIKA